jgi:hypothetical protein
MTRAKGFAQPAGHLEKPSIMGTELPVKTCNGWRWMTSENFSPEACLTTL